ncbi:hypothetical protein ScPMuIL_015261 [Solemya velum]
MSSYRLYDCDVTLHVCVTVPSLQVSVWLCRHPPSLCDCDVILQVGLCDCDVTLQVCVTVTSPPGCVTVSSPSRLSTTENSTMNSLVCSFNMFSLCLLFSLLSLSFCVGDYAACGEDEYLDKRTGGCVNCSVCPPNTIKRHPCGVFSDTHCTPFDEFDGFHQSGLQRVQLIPASNPDTPEHHQDTEQLPLDEMERIRLLEGPWFPVSVGLLCVLGLLCVGLVAYVTYICCLRKRRGRNPLPYDPELQNLVNITGCEYMQPYFSSQAKDFSGATNSRSPRTHVLLLPGGPVRLLPNLPEEDSGCSSQTDYVYIKSA